MLLDWMSKEKQGSGLWKEWRDEIIRLGLDHGIVTPFTSFVDNGETGDPGDQSDPGDGGNPTSIVDEEVSSVSARCTISPNPVRDVAAITVDLTGYDGREVRLYVVDLQGRVISTLFEGLSTASLLTLHWSVRNDTGMLVPPGIYFLAIDADGFRSLTQMIVAK